jgi:hypothetical protein
MNRTLALAASLLFVSSAAFAFHCPKDMAEIDAALAKNPQLTPEQLAEVKKLRASGEAAHKDKDHQKAVDDLAKAKKILGIS